MLDPKMLIKLLYWNAQNLKCAFSSRNSDCWN